MLVDESCNEYWKLKKSYACLVFSLAEWYPVHEQEVPNWKVQREICCLLAEMREMNSWTESNNIEMCWWKVLYAECPVIDSSSKVYFTKLLFPAMVKNDVGIFSNGCIPCYCPVDLFGNETEQAEVSFVYACSTCLWTVETVMFLCSDCVCWCVLRWRICNWNENTRSGDVAGQIKFVCWKSIACCPCRLKKKNGCRYV